MFIFRAINYDLLTSNRQGIPREQNYPLPPAPGGPDGNLENRTTSISTQQSTSADTPPALHRAPNNALNSAPVSGVNSYINPVMDEHNPDQLPDSENQTSAGGVSTHSGLFRALGGTDLYNNAPIESPEGSQDNKDSVFLPEDDDVQPDLPPPAPHSPPVSPGAQSYMQPLPDENGSNDLGHSTSLEAQPSQPGLFRALGGTDLYNNAL